MNKFLLLLVILVIGFAAFLFIQARASAKQSSPQLNNGALPGCPDKPNCVSSAVADTDSHYIDALSAPQLSMEALQQLVESDGGTIVQATDSLLIATYKSALFGFIDDLLLLRNNDKLEVRSSSRVGYSDFDANRKRVERLRTAITGANG